MCYLDMFWPVILKLLPYLKSALSNLANRKVSFKMKKKTETKFGSKSCPFWVFLSSNFEKVLSPLKLAPLS